MQIQVNTDHHTSGGEKVVEYVRAVVGDALTNYSDRLTRVEVHLGDENASGTGKDDMRCMIEARLERRQPIAVTHHAQTIDQAIEGAAGKLQRSLEHQLGKIRS